MNKKLVFAAGVVLALCVAGATGAQTLTRDQLVAQIQQEIDSLQAQLQIALAQQGTTTNVSSGFCYNFNTDLGFAQSGSGDVGQLHTALGLSGISYSPDSGNVYASPTATAVAQFQQRYNIIQTGYTGILTRTQLNRLYGCSNTTTNTTTTTNTNTCITGYSQRCQGNTIYWYDSCGNQGAVFQACSSNQTCSNGTCITNTTNTNTTTNSNACVSGVGCQTTNGVSFTVDCYGNVSQCSTGQTCQQTYTNTLSSSGSIIQSVSGGQCVTSNTTTTTTTNTNTCVAGAGCQTVGGTAYTVDCYGTVSACNAGQTCTPTYSNKLSSTGSIVQTVNGGQCQTPSTTTTNTNGNSCTAGVGCQTNTNGTFAVDCSGQNITKCSTGQTCTQTYTNSLSSTGSVIQTVTGGQCVGSAATTMNTNCTPNWQCKLSTCVNGSQSYQAVDANNCGGTSTISCSTVAQSCGTSTNSCVANATLQCSGNAVYNFDSCGNKGTLSQTCNSNQTCNNGNCQTTCTPNSTIQCVGNAAYSFDSCGVQGNLVQQCSTQQKCSSGACVTSCTANAYQQCVGASSLYWYDSCGNQGNLAQTCASSQTCSVNNCVTNTTTTTNNNNNNNPTCTANFSQKCSGNSVYNYDSCGNIGTQVQSCSSGQTCMASGSTASCVTNKPTILFTSPASGTVINRTVNGTLYPIAWTTTNPLNNANMVLSLVPQSSSGTMYYIINPTYAYAYPTQCSGDDESCSFYWRLSANNCNSGSNCYAAGVYKLEMLDGSYVYDSSWFTIQ